MSRISQAKQTRKEGEKEERAIQTEKTVEDPGNVNQRSMGTEA